MKISAHEEYGLRCLLEIGRHGAGKSLTIPEISAAEDISVSYVAKLLRILRRAGFLKSVRGKSGGYTLARPAGQIAIGDVLAALGDRVFPSDFCTRHAGQGSSCVHSTECSLRPLWRTVQSAVDRVLAQTTLQDILSEEHEMTGWIESSRLIETRSGTALSS